MAAKRPVKCPICGKSFDLNSEQGVRYSARRYAHYKCYPQGELIPLANGEDPNLVQLKEYTKKLLGKEYNAARVNKQIKDFKAQYDYSYTGMLKSLVYFYEVKGNSIEKANGGIGIIPFIYQNAYNYYLSLFQAQQNNKDKDISEYTCEVREITIKPPKIVPKKHFFKFLEDDINEEQ